MKLEPACTVAELAQIIGARFIGPADHLVTGINEIHRVEAGDLTFVDVEKYFRKALDSAATTILINKEVEPPAGKALIVSDDPFRDYNRLTEHHQPRSPLDRAGQPRLGGNVRIGQNVVFGENVEIGDDVEIGHNVVIGSNVRIGSGTVIHASVTIYDFTEIGKGCMIQSGARIGSEAFYYKKREWGRDKMLSKGVTILEDYVDIGSNTTIDRGVSAETRIGAHTKIDNLVQIGHDTVIGKRCILASQVGIAGVSQVGDDCILWGQVGVASDSSIGDRAIVMAQSGVQGELEGGKTYFGSPAADRIQRWREIAAVNRLPVFMQRVEERFIEENS